MTDYSPRGPTVGRERATLDELFEVLSDASRRRILTALADANPRDEAELSPAELVGDERHEDVPVMLYHVHLPKLDDAGFVEWTPGSKTITRGPRFEEIAPLLESLIASRGEFPAGWP